jgi:hypothetical protein
MVQERMVPDRGKSPAFAGSNKVFAGGEPYAVEARENGRSAATIGFCLTGDDGVYGRAQ